mmetsp:Transcript_67725/g.214355  ORF Transcript_67725/g.214355 Transcript_67725/m.214355 type:complete len:218 (+) Transcript_67725:933-1586(+)
MTSERAPRPLPPGWDGPTGSRGNSKASGIRCIIGTAPFGGGEERSEEGRAHHEELGADHVACIGLCLFGCLLCSCWVGQRGGPYESCSERPPGGGQVGDRCSGPTTRAAGGFNPTPRPSAPARSLWVLWCSPRAFSQPPLPGAARPGGRAEPPRHLCGGATAARTVFWGGGLLYISTFFYIRAPPHTPRSDRLNLGAPSSPISGTTKLAAAKSSSTV